jgi:hypothetical protein
MPHDFEAQDMSAVTSVALDAAMPAVPPSRALLISEVPFSGRARVRARGGKLPLFGEPRTRRRFSKQYYAACQKSLFDAGVIWSGRWASIVLALPEADGAFVDCEHCREVSLCHAGKSPRRAQLPDEIDTPISHGRLVIFHVRR